MKLNIELNEDEEMLLSEAFESAIAEAYFTEIDDEFKNEYYENVQALINKLGLSVKVDAVIDELIELNSMEDDDLEDEVEIEDDE